MMYKGYDIRLEAYSLGNTSTGYKIFKDNKKVTQMHLNTIRVAKYLIDTFLNTKNISNGTSNDRKAEAVHTG